LPEIDDGKMTGSSSPGELRNRVLIVTRMGSRRLGVLAGLVVALVCVVAPQPAGAHALLVRSQPANGSTVPVAPDVVRLWFNEEISSEVSTARLVDRAGAAVAGTKVHAAAQVLELRVPDLARGTYGVLWRVLAEDDGHTTSGTVVFSVGASSGALAVTSKGGSATSLVDTARKWLALSLLAGVVGGLAVAGLVVGRVRPQELGAPARRRLLTGVIACAALGVVVGLADAITQAHRLAPSGRSWLATLGDLLVSSRWGHLWLVREAALVALVAVVVALRRRREPAAGAVAAGLALVLVWVEALGSHAATAGSPRNIAIVSDAVHVLAACVWLGGLAALIVLLADARRRDLLRAGREPFTVLVGGSVLAVVATGLYNAGRAVDTVGELTSTSYGRALLIKTGLLAAMLVLGLASARRWRSGAPPVPRMVAVEAAVGAALLVAVAVLANTPPARGGVGGSGGESRSASIADLLVTVSAAPNRPGANGVTVLVASSRRPPPARVSAVTLHGVRLAPVGADRYFGTVELTRYGAVPLTAVLQRGAERLTVTVPWQVTGSSSRGQPLAPYVNGLAIALLAAAVAAAAYTLRRRNDPRDLADQEEEVVAAPATSPS
jgi:copper transport protein